MVDYKVDGFQNERNFVQELDGKRVKQLQPLYYRMIIQLFGKVWGFKKVHAWVDERKKKYDILGKEVVRIDPSEKFNNVLLEVADLERNWGGSN